MDRYFRFLWLLIIVGPCPMMLTGCYHTYQTSMPYGYNGRMAQTCESTEPCSYTSQEFLEMDHDYQRDYLSNYNDQFIYSQDYPPNPSKKLTRPPSGGRSSNDVEIPFTESRGPKKISDE